MTAVQTHSLQSIALTMIIALFRHVQGGVLAPLPAPPSPPPASPPPATAVRLST